MDDKRFIHEWLRRVMDGTETYESPIGVKHVYPPKDRLRAAGLLARLNGMFDRRDA